MSYHIIDEVMHADTSDLTSAELVTLLCVAWHANADRQAWPGNPLLARETRLTPRSVRRSLDSLAADGKWLKVTFETYHKRVLTVADPLPMRTVCPNDADGVSSYEDGVSAHEDTVSAYADGVSTEQVSNRSEEHVSEPVKEQVQHSVLRQGGEEMKPEPKPVTSNTGLLEHFESRMRITLRDYELPIPGGYSKRAALGRLKQIRAEGIGLDELVALVDLYMKTPTLWNRRVHPASDFVSGNTIARLRNRHHEIRVTQSVAEPTSSGGTPWNSEHLLKYLEPDDEGSDQT